MADWRKERLDSIERNIKRIERAISHIRANTEVLRAEFEKERAEAVEATLVENVEQLNKQTAPQIIGSDIQIEIPGEEESNKEEVRTHSSGEEEEDLTDDEDDRGEIKPQFRSAGDYRIGDKVKITNNYNGHLGITGRITNVNKTFANVFTQHGTSLRKNKEGELANNRTKDIF